MFCVQHTIKPSACKGSHVVHALAYLSFRQLRKQFVRQLFKTMNYYWHLIQKLLSEFLFLFFAPIPPRLRQTTHNFFSQKQLFLRASRV